VSAALTAATAADLRRVGERIGAVARAGDLIVLDGPLGAGKTTVAQGIGAAMEVRGPVTSPTFVIARIHPSTVGGPALVHVDAYRLTSLADLDDLDLDTAFEECVTVVEWGKGLVEVLSDAWLLVSIERSDDDRVDERQVTLSPVGRRWAERLAGVLS
jgi:tRNA threonylcarbamoyladenosine biosynthesis protein TsaE